jgi:ABC-type transport system involved in cytochrome c biogenesis permease subunit
MGQMYVMYKGRVCPLQTLAKDFTTKLYGKARYQGYTPEQVFSGWLFYTDEWQNAPIPKLEKDLKRNKQRAANEKQQIINMLLNGQLLKMFPHADSAREVTWYSQNDQLPLEIPDDEYLFIRKQLSLCKEYVVTGNLNALNDLFDKTKIYQEKYSLGLTQPTPQYRAERLYNRLTMGRWLPMANITLGLLCFAIALICIGKGRNLPKNVHGAIVIWMSLLCAYLALLFILRWIVGGHVPMAGSFDSMNLLALSICIITLIITKVETRHGTSLQEHRTTVKMRRAAYLQDNGNKYEMALPAGLLMTGVVLLVQMMGGSNPPVTHLMPVLSSPLLSLHVSVIMLAYALLFFIMLNGISAVVVRISQPENRDYLQRLQDISTIMLYPAVALLTAGIFIGAIWANISWGNYWSWDPKEVWALITLLVYAIPMHKSIWTAFRNPMFFHIYGILAFLSVLITYFGVNFLLGGMHSYA